MADGDIQVQDLRKPKMVPSADTSLFKPTAPSETTVVDLRKKPGSTPVAPPTPAPAAPPTSVPPNAPGAFQRKPGSPIEQAPQDTWREALKQIPPTVLSSFGIDPNSEHGVIYQSAKNLSKIPGQMYENLKKERESKNPMLVTGTLYRTFVDPIRQQMHEGVDEALRGHKEGDKNALVRGLTKFASAAGQTALMRQGGGATEDAASSLSNITKDAMKAFPKDAIVAASNKVLEESATNAKNIVDKASNSFIKNANASIGRDVAEIAHADATASRLAGQAGSFKSSDISAAIDSIKKGMDARDTPATDAVIKNLEKYPKDLSWNNLKDIRSFTDEIRRSATGKDAAILGNAQQMFSEGLRDRAFDLGKGDKYLAYTNDTKALRGHQQGVWDRLSSADTGLKFFNELSKQSNKPQLESMFDILERRGGAPSGFMDQLLKEHEPIHRLASLSEGTSVAGMRGGRLGAFMRHPLAAGLGASAVGVGSMMAGPFMPMSARFVLSLGAAMKAADLMDRIDAAEAIRNLGGPRGVGLPGPAQPPANLSGNPTPFGPGGGSVPPGLPPASAPTGGGAPSGGVPPSVPSPSGLLSRLVPKENFAYRLRNVGDQGVPGGSGHAHAIAGETALDEAKGYTESRSATEGGKGQEIVKVDLNKLDPKDYSRRQGPQKADWVRFNRPLGEHEVEVVPAEARGRESSARRGMTRDTPEARRAKAAERVAKAREEAGRTQSKMSLDAQARELAGKVTPNTLRGVNIVDIEETAKGLDPGGIIYKGLQKLRRSMKWDDDTYRGYLEDFILKRIDQLASGK